MGYIKILEEYLGEAVAGLLLALAYPVTLALAVAVALGVVWVVPRPLFAEGGILLEVTDLDGNDAQWLVGGILLPEIAVQFVGIGTGNIHLDGIPLTLAQQQGGG